MVNCFVVIIFWGEYKHGKLFASVQETLQLQALFDRLCCWHNLRAKFFNFRAYQSMLTCYMPLPLIFFRSWVIHTLEFLVHYMK